jgi:DNA-binding FrmR family transcriptional regulator
VASYDKDREDILAQLKNVEGRLRSIQEMVAEDKYCVDILTELSSIIDATEKIGLLILQDHIQGCVRNALTQDGGESYVRELVDAVERFMKS